MDQDRTLLQEIRLVFRAYMLPFVLGISTALLLFMAVIPSWVSFAESRRRLNDRRDASGRLKEKIEILASLDDMALKDALDRAVESIPLVAPYQTSLSMLSALAEHYRFGIEKLSLSLEQTQERSVLRLDIDLLGSKDALTQFLSDIEHAVPLVTIETVEMRGSSTADTEPALPYRAALELAAYQSPAPQDIGRPSDRLPEFDLSTNGTLRTLSAMRSFAQTQPSSDTPPKGTARLFPE